jgi:hypothetical protein
VKDNAKRLIYRKKVGELEQKLHVVFLKVTILTTVGRVYLNSTILTTTNQNPAGDSEGSGWPPDTRDK